MTKQMSFKKRVRTRMTKTGETYAAARRSLVEKSDRARAPSTARTKTAPSGEGTKKSASAPAKRGADDRAISDTKVHSATGKDWQEWFALLDAWGGAKRPHGEIATWLHEEHGVPGWWAQMVTVEYERARGLRVRGQKKDGWTVNVSKTVAVSVERLYEAVVDDAMRAKWWEGPPLRLRTATPHRSARYDHEGSTRVHLWFTAVNDAKSSVAFSHERLPDQETADRLRPLWRKRMAALATWLASEAAPGTARTPKKRPRAR